MAIIERDIDSFYKDKPIALALGYFDSVHLGHCTLVDECKKSGYLPSIFTFRNNPSAILSNSGDSIYTYDERVCILDKLGVGLCISAEFNKSFMELSGEEFLGKLIQNFDIKVVVLGKDFKCGLRASFHEYEIFNFFSKKNIKVIVKDLLFEKDKKIASRDIKKYLENGEIEKANKLLPYKFWISGKVKKGRNVGGAVVGFPTANIDYPISKVKLKEGVYITNIIIDDNKYRAITNIGTHPTFSDYVFNIESFIFNFNGDLYDKYIKVEFLDYIREVKKFNSPEELSSQIASDIEKAKKYNEIK